jgi:hypothetical protein
MLCSTVKASVGEAIKELVTTKFDRHDDNALFATSLKLYGMAKFLEQVGTAQIELMDAWLDPSIVNRAGDREVPRGEHRNAGIYRDFYDLPYIVVSPEPLDSILKGFHAGTTYVEERRFLPSFAEFRRLSRRSQRENRTMPRLIKPVVTIHDEALEAIRRIETLAGLMRVLGHERDAEPVDAALVSEAAGMIRTETMRIREAVEAMRRLVPTGDETTSPPEKKSQTNTKMTAVSILGLPSQSLIRRF